MELNLEDSQKPVRQRAEDSIYCSGVLSKPVGTASICEGIGMEVVSGRRRTALAGHANGK